LSLLRDIPLMSCTASIAQFRLRFCFIDDLNIGSAQPSRRCCGPDVVPKKRRAAPRPVPPHLTRRGRAARRGRMFASAPGNTEC